MNYVLHCRIVTQPSFLVHLGRPILSDGQLDTVTLWQRNPRLGALSDHEYVLQPGRKRMANGIFAMHDLEGAWMLLTVCDDTDTAHVISTANHCHVARFKL